jgi:hypothetical protein
MTAEQWILAHPWRLGSVGGCVVCDVPPGRLGNTMPETWSYYGGYLVLESCPTAVCTYLVNRHNAELQRMNESGDTQKESA